MTHYAHGKISTLLTMQILQLPASPNSFPVLEVDDRLYSFTEAMEKYEEPLLRKLENRFSLFPINYDDVYEIYKKSRASYWQPEEISLIKDNFDDLSQEEQHFVEHILAFFAASDGIVNENIDVNFSSEIEYPEVRNFYATQTAIEAIHSETYSILLEKYIKDPKKKLKLQNAINTIPCIKKKAEWALRKIQREKFEYYYSNYHITLDKKDIREIYLPGDDEVVEAAKRLELVRQKLELCERTIKNLTSVGFDIKNVIEYRKLMSGII